jgi:hypothetical protein
VARPSQFTLQRAKETTGGQRPTLTDLSYNNQIRSIRGIQFFRQRSITNGIPITKIKSASRFEIECVSGAYVMNIQAE